ncbi:hypothetical protein [Metabacillus malikii]|nr:hypothetical protein [Metabacillus malikii]
MKNISLRLKIQNGLHRIHEEHFSSLENSKWASWAYEEHFLHMMIQNGLHRIYEEHFSSLENSKWASSGL